MISDSDVNFGNADDWSKPSPSWHSVADLQREKDEISKKVLKLPITEMRAVGYLPPPLPSDVPLPGKDVEISTVHIQARDGGSIPIRVYRCLDAVPSSLLFFNIPGGGWVSGTPETEEAQNRFIAVKNKAVVASIEYRKAPEFPYPVPLNDCCDAFDWCRNNPDVLGTDSNRIIVGGGSAGANLTAALSIRARTNGVSGIIGQILNIPVTCHPQVFPVGKYPYESYVQNAEAPVVSSWKMTWFWTQYLSACGIEGATDPNISPLLAEQKHLVGLPPTLVQVAGMDPLRDEGLAYAQALENCGIDVSLKLYSGLPHGFYIHPSLPESTEYFQTMVDWILDLAIRNECF